MRGTIKSRSAGSYELRFDVGTDPLTNKRQQQSITVRGTRHQAEERLHELMHQVATGVYVQSGKVTLSDYLTRWLSDYAKSNLTPRSYERYADICRLHLIPALRRLQLNQIKPGDLQKLYSDKLKSGLAPLTVRYIHAVIHRALATAEKWQLVSRNVADNVDPPKANHTEIKTWNETQVKTFLEAIRDSEYYPLFYTDLSSGMRRSEILAIRWSDVDLLTGQVQVSRTLHMLKNNSFIFSETKSSHSKRLVSLPPSATIVLREHYEHQKELWQKIGREFTNDTLVFCTIEGRPYRPNTVSRAWDHLAARAGLPVINFHAARHTFATIMLRAGVHPLIVSKQLGHSGIEITMNVYSHVVPDIQDAAAKRFDEMVNTGYNDTVSNKLRAHSVNKTDD